MSTAEFEALLERAAEILTENIRAISMYHGPAAFEGSPTCSGSTRNSTREAEALRNPVHIAEDGSIVVPNEEE